MKKILLIISLILSGVTVSAQEFDPSKPMMTKLTDGVYQYHQYFYSSLVVITEDGVLVTDPSKAHRAADMRKAIRKLTDKPVVKVVYSHDHFDHTRGGQIFKNEGAQFITHEGCTELLSRDLENKVVLPDVTYRETMSIKLGDKQVDLRYYGPNDGNCMSIIHMPKDKVLLAVDWHLPGYVNEPERLVVHNYIGVLKTMERVRKELDYEHVISGHMPTSSVAQLEEDYQFTKALFDAVWKGMQAGKSTEELMKTVKLPQFSHWMGYEKNLPGHVQRMSYTIWHGN